MPPENALSPPPLQSVRRSGTAADVLLGILVETWRADGPPGIVDIEDLAARLGKRTRDVHRLVQPLIIQGVIAMDHHSRAVYFTPEGYAAAAPPGDGVD